MKTSIKANYLYNSAYQVLVLLVPIITTPYISRVLGAEGVGIYSFNNSIAYYFVLFTLLGLNNYGNREIAKVRGNRQHLSKTFFNIYALQISCGLIANIAYAMYAFLFSENKTISLVLWLYVLSASFDINWFFFGLEKFRLTTTRNFIVKILTTASIFLFVRTSNDVVTYCFILSFGFLISQLLLWPFVKKEVSYVKPTLKEIRKHIKPNLFLFITVIAVSLFKIMDKIMLGIMTTNIEVGLYESSERVIQIPTAFITSLGTVMLPRMSNLVEKGKIKDGLSLTRKSVLFAAFLSSSLGFGLMGISREFVPVFFGKGFEKCVYLFWIILPSTFFLAFANVIRTQYLLPHSNDRVYVVSALIGAVSNLVINFILIPSLGSIGAAIGTLISEAMVCCYQALKCYPGLPIKKYVLETFPFLFSGVAMWIMLINLNFSANIIFTMFLKIILGTVIYFILTFILMLVIDRKLLFDIRNYIFHSNASD